jgi:hypothetical protein
MHEQATMLIAAERQATLHAEARRHALARLASCCRRGVLRRALAAWRERTWSTATCCA